MDKIGIILLAAGAATRYESFPKQLLKINDKTLIRHAIEQALAGCSAPLFCVVLGANSELIKPEINDLQVEIIINEDWPSGMGSSIKCGLRHLLEIEPHIDAVVLQLCDQPLISGEIINRLIESYNKSQKKITASVYGKTFGVPALFEKSLFGELLNLNSQAGAKLIIEKYKTQAEFIQIPEAAIDIDTRADYERFLSGKNILRP